MIDESTLPIRATPPDEGLLRFIVGGFLARYPPRTRRLYQIHMRQWFAWLDSHGIAPLDAKRAHIETYGRWMVEERGLKSSSARGKVNVVCGMYRYAHIDNLITIDPGVHVRRPITPFVSTTNGLTRPEAANLLGAAEKAGPMTHAWVSLLITNGLRISELVGIDIEHLGQTRGYRTVFLPSRKGGKVATLALSLPTMWAVEQAVHGRTTGPLILGHDGQRISEGAVRRQLKRLCLSIGITKRITPHSLRHAFVTLSRDAGVPDRDIMASTSHSDARMLEYYDRNKGSVERNATHILSAFIGAAG